MKALLAESEHIAVHPDGSKLLVPNHWKADRQQELQNNAAALLQRLRSEQISEAGFHKAVPSALLDAIRSSRWIVVRVEATAATPYSEAIRITKYSTIAGRPWPLYRANNLGAKASTRPRMRVLTTLCEGLGTVAFDIDALSSSQRAALCEAVLSTETLIGHDLGFDLHWLIQDSSARPAHLLDIQLLCAGLQPGLLLQPFKAEQATEDLKAQAREAVRRDHGVRH